MIRYRNNRRYRSKYKRRRNTAYKKKLSYKIRRFFRRKRRKAKRFITENCKSIIGIILAIIFIITAYKFDWGNALEQTEIYNKINKGMCVTFINVGNGDSALINADGYNILIDVGVKSDAEEISTLLDRYHIKTLDLIILSHLDKDHVGGLKTILNNYEVKKIITGNIKYKNKPTIYKYIINHTKNSNTKLHLTKTREMFTYNKLTFKIFSPHKTHKSNNDNSVVVKATYGKNSFLFTGDISEKVENIILKKKFNIQSDVIKIAHHGSGTSTSKKFLKKVNPDYAIISIGNNYNNLPNLEVVKRLKTYKKLKLYRTDKHGNIFIHSNGKVLDVSYSEHKKNLT